MDLTIFIKNSGLKTILKDKKFRLVREWSNRELKKFSSLFQGEVLNVSGWKDVDKEGQFYRNYFPNCSNYFISNHPSLGKGFQNQEGEISLDLEKNIDHTYVNKFDVVFNHTTLEHIFDFRKALQNICLMSKDIVILIVPFLQQLHEDGFDDYWRFSPKAINRLFNENGFETLYLSYNSHKRASVYIFCIASKYPEKWEDRIKNISIKDKRVWLDPYGIGIGSRTIINNVIFRIVAKIKTIIKKQKYY